MCGESGQAQQLVEEMGRRFPQDSFFKASWLPMIHAAVEIHRGDPARAVELLQPAGRGELGTNAALVARLPPWPGATSIRALDAKRGPSSRRSWTTRACLRPRTSIPSAMTLYPLAQLGRARAAARTGDVDESRKAYEALLALWKDADSDIPILRAARREYRQLSRAANFRRSPIGG